MVTNYQKEVCFLDGAIFIKESDGIIYETKKDSILELKKIIQSYIVTHPEIYRVKDIIFESTKECFSVELVKAKPKDVLYDSLSQFVSDDPNYRDRINNRREVCNKKSKIVKQKREEERIFDEYKFEKSMNYVKRNRSKVNSYGRISRNI